jgi:hypothetical protein
MKPVTNVNRRMLTMKETRVYTREDIRNLWRRYQRGDMAAGSDFALIANAQGQTFKTLQAEIEPECREEDQQPVSNTSTRAEQRRRAGIVLWEKTEAYKQRQPELSNRETFRLVLLENPTLAEQYTGFPYRTGRD